MPNSCRDAVEIIQAQGVGEKKGFRLANRASIKAALQTYCSLFGTGSTPLWA